jgi:hypothetical protein
MVNWPLMNRNAGVTGGGEAEQLVRPVVDGQDFFGLEGTHGVIFADGLCAFRL